MKLINRRSAIMALTKHMSDGTDYRNEIVEQCICAIRKLKVHDSCGEYDGVDECEPLVTKSFYDDVPVVLL